jgi:hypothetical protein
MRWSSSRPRTYLDLRGLGRRRDQGRHRRCSSRALKQPVAAAENWSTSIQVLCKACSEGRPYGEGHDHPPGEPPGVTGPWHVGIAAREEAAGSAHPRRMARQHSHRRPACAACSCVLQAVARSSFHRALCLRNHETPQLFPLLLLVPCTHRDGTQGPRATTTFPCTSPRANTSSRLTPPWPPTPWCRCSKSTAKSFSQSMAIIEYLDEKHPTPALLPADAMGRAKVRALAQSIACEIHPINNLRVLKYLVKELKLDEAAKNAWYATGAAKGWKPLSASWPSCRPRPIATVTRPRWPTAAWCRRSSMPNGST